MPKITFSQTNFTAGELSPRLHGRIDIARYANGAEKVRDLIPQVYGGVKRRPGSLFVQATKNSAKRSRLVPFIKDATTAYMLEFGDLYVRVFKDGAAVESSPGVPYEIVSPYTAAQVLEMDYTQGADTMFLFHEDVAPYRLVCAGDTSWTLAAAAFLQTPFEEPGSYPNATLYPSEAAAVGATITLAAGTVGAASHNSSVGWSAGVMGLTTDGNHNLTTGDWVLISDSVPAGWNSVEQATVTTATEYNIPKEKHQGSSVEGGNTQKITGVAVFSAGDVGSCVKINGGIVKITSVTSNFIARGIVLQELASAVPAGPNAWSLHAPAWSASRGYPRTGTLFEQRLNTAGSPTFPQTIWGSITGAYLDFTPGVNDDDGFAFTIASDVANPIRYLASGRVLVVLTSGGEFTVEGGTEKPLAPTSARIKSRKNYGCALVRPVRVGEQELFVQRAGKKVRSFGYSLANDEWTGPDLSVLAEHLAEAGVVDICWQQEPMPVVWLAREDGALVSITLDRDQDVVAWAWHEEFGQPDAAGAATVFVESVASIPTTDGDEVWLIARRTVNGSSVRYVERLSESTTMDCAVVDSAGTATTAWSGLGHLEGATVHVVGDGAYMGTAVVSGGAVTLSSPVSSVNIGLNFRPRLRLLPPEVQGQMGSASGNAMRTSEVTLRFFETTGAKVNGNEMTFRRTGAQALQPPQPFTGVKRVENLGWGRGEDAIEITQEQPMPFYLLSVTRKFTFNEG